MAIYKLSLEQKYRPKIYGLGEIYEQISVERKRKRLRERFGSGILFLCPNKNHSGQGLSPKELKKKVREQQYQVLASGFVDSPLWKSKPGQVGKSPFLGYSLLVILAKLVFRILVIFEFIWQGQNTSHLIYVLGRKKQDESFTSSPSTEKI